MIKVFQLIRSIHLGGAEIVAFNLSEYCKADNTDFEFVIIELHKSTDEYSVNKKNELKAKNIVYSSLGPTYKMISLLFGHFSLTYQILKQKPDIIHSHTDLPDLVLANTKKLFSLFHIKFPKVVRTIHNTALWTTHNILGRYVEKAFQDEYIVGVSYQSLIAYEALRQKYQLKISDCKSVVYNGCKMPLFKEHQFKINSDKINIAFCGRFEEQKGIDVLLQRIKTVNSKYPDSFLFHIIGSGTYLNEVLKMATTNVLVYDAVPNISDKLYDFDYLIMPSRFEGLGLISIEASFSKVPVIASNVKAILETLPPEWPLQFQLEDEIELLKIFENILHDKYDIVNLKNLAYAYVASKFSMDVMSKAYSSLYVDAVNKM
jgi:glycosyltransferase involved in cell wall biosynthesis